MNIEQLAREAGGTKDRDEVFGVHYVMSIESLERFAALVRNEALEEAAEMCIRQAGLSVPSYDIAKCASAIRSMKEVKT
jgi:hypothetical protein